jgi:outer membrane immunogenic protein
MNKLLLAGTCWVAIAASVQAADLSAYKAPPAYYNWSGFYAGGNFGGIWSDGNLTDSLTGTTFSADHIGFAGGGQVGFNYQVGSFVWGIEGGLDRTSLDTTDQTPTSPVTGDVLRGYANTRWVTTLAARVGVASDRWLAYVKGGGGWVESVGSIVDQTTGAVLNGSNWSSGWLVGGGLEYGLTANWTARIEYEYLRPSNWTGATPFLPGDTFNLSRDVQMLTAGFNYRFDWTGLTTR